MAVGFVYPRNSTSVRAIKPGSSRSISLTTDASSRSACFSSLETVTTLRRGTLPEVVVFDLGNGDVELLDAILDAPQHHALLFQRPGARDVELDGEMADDQLR